MNHPRITPGPLSEAQARGLLIMLATAEITQGYRLPQLTTGAESCRCELVDTGTMFARVRTHCPVHRWQVSPVVVVGPLPTPPCSCRYGLYEVRDGPGPYVLWKPPGIRRATALTRCFRINPGCPHHGDGNKLVRVERHGDHDVLVDPLPPWSYTLDEQERHGD
jgi:hypothetical protein